ncbi:FtsK domain-containing protein OS=Streptomyces tendae OX=1932 GN=GUR47_32570 PE=4 SV=1 [Streptomyces tendae]
MTVVVADQLDALDGLTDAVRQHTRARVARLGPATAEELANALGAPPHTTPLTQVPPGRGYARLGTGPVHRLQVPATPDPGTHDATSEAHRQAVLDLLPPRTTPADGEQAPLPPEAEAEAEAEAVAEAKGEGRLHGEEGRPGHRGRERAGGDRVGHLEPTPVTAEKATAGTPAEPAPADPVPAEAVAAETSSWPRGRGGPTHRSAPAPSDRP